MIIHNWELWNAARESKVDKQVLRQLEKMNLVKSGTISGKDLLQQLKKSGLAVRPEIAVSSSMEEELTGQEFPRWIVYLAVVNLLLMCALLVTLLPSLLL